MVDPKRLAESLVEAVDSTVPDGSEGDLWLMQFLVALQNKARKFMDSIAEAQEHGPDQTGNIWPGCICNDARYELGHMESCPWHGHPPDRPDE